MNRLTEAEGPGSPEEIRNVVLVGASGGGKTALFETMVAARIPGRRSREGDSASTLALTAAAVPTGGLVVTLLDTPGHPDFVGEVRAGLRAADAALFVVSAADGVDEATRLLWRECEVLGMPRAVAVTRLEQARADFEATAEACRRAFGDAQPLALPLMEDGSVRGLLNLLRRTVTEFSAGEGVDREPTVDEGELIDAQRGELIESVIEESEDETLLERYLGGQEVDTDAVALDLRAAIATARFFPVLPTHAPSGVGVEALLELFEKGFPSPVHALVPTVYTPAGGDFGPVTCDPDGPLVAEVVRTATDPFVGRQSLVRVFSGTLRPDEPVHLSGHLQHFAAHLVEEHADHDTDDERIGPLAAPVVEESRPLSAGIAGSIVLVSKLAGAETSDTLSRKDRPALVEPWLLPNPLLPVAIHARSKGDEDKLASALQRLVAEDVTMRLEHNAETHQLVLWAMGPAHVEHLISTLESRYHVPVEVEPMRTSLRETFVRPTTVQGRLVKQSGGHGQYAVCQLQIDPLERGAGIEFVDKVVGGAVPRQFIASVEKGARIQLEKGVLAGYPVVDVRVTLLDGKAHSVDSSDMAFQTAAGMALREAANDTTVSMLEPIDEVRIEVSDDAVGGVLADLRGRRGQVHGTEPSELGGRTVIHAEIPAHELSRYAVDLRSVSHGTGTFTRQFVRYDYMPPALAREVTAQ
ncbi:elongation factor G-like protein EF-G2 [Nostocoides sp. HKS02]|uniref:elongation factor G-like protein EF-G2 n=1 Tax=Nostocoides sp. HKS02 TaxID=1813880 RepID=UPI0012B45484|nr:elongation factor G-like protein EF-G2 [Tetrasphaera sp. HKS02]QGN58727.1 elongation factor G-like protein EF-G2 [Tetrasphaera sp. HKS02]